MTDTPALLPPDPTRDGYYWFRSLVFEGEFMVWRWSARDQTWADGDIIMGPTDTLPGCTLATRHRIPTPAELEAVWDTLVKIERGAAFAVIAAQDGNAKDCDEQKVRAHAFGHAAAMLRSALGGVQE